MMDNRERIEVLQFLKNEKIREYRKAVAEYVQPFQTVISREEIQALREELDELYAMIDAIEIETILR
ncbi:hypothetical protein [Flavobacterium sp. DG1-102-2]|uniref:hypothetical protein n=1 Tax=Flavobacterium sp. DG1-102-2 TaxID=3081663 RepID=UPI00294B708B|nr:hypothetical protein [Flavobacterium sp. DG1-102-2]